MALAPKRYRSDHGFYYIHIDEIPEEVKEKFCKWISGQTCPIVDDTDRSAAYYEDWLRFQRVITGGKVLWD